jgi:hypothetical protein
MLDPADAARLRATLVSIGGGYLRNPVRASRDGGEFTLRAEVHQDHLRIEVEDAGGPWLARPREDGRPHDDPDSDLYAESSDADTVIGYIIAHS